jgi:hypothetical protein
VSKGPGIIQRLILDAASNGVTPRPEGSPLFPAEPKVYPLLYIAHAAGYDTTKLSVRQSFARAARKLAANGQIDLWNGDMHAVSHPDHREQLTGKDWDAAETMCGLRFDDITDPLYRTRRNFAHLGGRVTNLVNFVSDAHRRPVRKWYT